MFKPFQVVGVTVRIRLNMFKHVNMFKRHRRPKRNAQNGHKFELINDAPERFVANHSILCMDTFRRGMSVVCAKKDFGHKKHRTDSRMQHSNIRS